MNAIDVEEKYKLTTNVSNFVVTLTIICEYVCRIGLNNSDTRRQYSYRVSSIFDLKRHLPYWHVHVCFRCRRLCERVFTAL